MRLDPTLTASIIEHYHASSSVFEPMVQLATVPHHFGGYDTSAPEEIDELASLLISSDLAGDQYRMISLGAAPGEWAIRAERAYRSRRPIGAFVACCIEADLDHVTMLNEFITANGAQPELFEIRQAAMAGQDGCALFPIINAAIDWGAGVAAVATDETGLAANVAINELDARDRIAANGGKALEFRTVTAVSLATLLADMGTVDYLHSDIQGAEAEVFPVGLTALDRQVRMCCVSTHAVAIEALLIDAFAAHGWDNRASHSCVTVGAGHEERVVKDGIFVWSNPRLVEWPL